MVPEDSATYGWRMMDGPAVEFAAGNMVKAESQISFLGNISLYELHNVEFLAKVMPTGIGVVSLVPFACRSIL